MNPVISIKLFLLTIFPTLTSHLLSQINYQIPEGYTRITSSPGYPATIEEDFDKDGKPDGAIACKKETGESLIIIFLSSKKYNQSAFATFTLDSFTKCSEIGFRKEKENLIVESNSYSDFFNLCLTYNKAIKEMRLISFNHKYHEPIMEPEECKINLLKNTYSYNTYNNSRTQNIDLPTVTLSNINKYINYLKDFGIYKNAGFSEESSAQKTDQSWFNTAIAMEALRSLGGNEDTTNEEFLFTNEQSETYISDEEPIYSISNSEFNEKNILKLLVGGSYDITTNHQKWKAPAGTFLPIDVDRNAYTQIDTILSFNGAEQSYQLVVTHSSQITEEGNFEEFVATAPCIGLALFSKQENEWVLEGFNPMVDLFGIMNYVPEKRIVNIGPDKYVIAFTQDIRQDVGEEKWFLIEQDFPSFLEYYYAYPGGDNLEKLIYTRVEPIEVNNEDAGEFFDLKVTQYEETYDEKTDKSKQKILETKILTPSFNDFKLKYPYNEK